MIHRTSLQSAVRRLALDLDEGHADLGQGVAQRRLVLAEPGSEPVDDGGQGVDGQAGLVEARAAGSAGGWRPARTARWRGWRSPATPGTEASRRWASAISSAISSSRARCSSVRSARVDGAQVDVVRCRAGVRSIVGDRMLALRCPEAHRCSLRGGRCRGRAFDLVPYADDRNRKAGPASGGPHPATVVVPHERLTRAPGSRFVRCGLRSRPARASASPTPFDRFWTATSSDCGGGPTQRMRSDRQ